MRKTREEAESSLKAAAETIKRFYDRKRTDAREYKPGDMVYVEGTDINTVRPAKKLDDKRYGPFKVLKKIGTSSYRLALPASWKAKYPVFNEALLSPYVAPVFLSQQTPPPPPPDLVDDHEEYEVEEILDSRLYRGKLQYFVHWKNYGKEHDSWVPASDFTAADHLIDDFHKKHPSAPRPLPQNTRFIYKRLENFTTTPRLPGHLYNWENGKIESCRAVVRTQP
jgi:hypothetical protein